MTYTGAAITDAAGIARLNSMAAATGGAVNVSVDATASVLADLSTGSADQISVEVNSTITNDAFATLDGKTGAAISFDATNGVLRDSLSEFITSGGAKTGHGAITNQSTVNITLTDTNITSGDFVDLQTLAGNDTGGTITANVKGIAAAIGSGLSNLKAATDKITFTVDSHADNNKTNLALVSAMTSENNSIDVASITDTYAKVADVLGDAKVNHADAAVTISSGASQLQITMTIFHQSVRSI